MTKGKVLTIGPNSPGVRPGRPEEKWNWSEDVVVREQNAITVYENVQEGIVIRQQAGWDEEKDHLIVLASPGAAYRVIEAVQRALEEMKERKKNGG